MEIRKFRDDEVEEIVALTCAHMTDGDAIADEVRKSVAEGNLYAYKVIEEGETIGFISFKEGIEFTVPHPDIEEEIGKMYGDKRVFYGDAVWVSPKARNKGIGTKLLHIMYDGLIEAGADYLMNEYWVYPGGKSTILPLSNVFGEPLYHKKVPGFYAELDKYGMSCPICGKNCKCSAEIIIYSMKGEE